MLALAVVQGRPLTPVTRVRTSLGSPNVPCHRKSDLSNRKHERFLEFELPLRPKRRPRGR